MLRTAIGQNSAALVKNRNPECRPGMVPRYTGIAPRLSFLHSVAVRGRGTFPAMCENLEPLIKNYGFGFRFGDWEYATKRREFLRSPAPKTLISARGPSAGGLRATDGQGRSKKKVSDKKMNGRIQEKRDGMIEKVDEKEER